MLLLARTTPLEEVERRTPVFRRPVPGTGRPSRSDTITKRHIADPMQKYVLNPLDKLAFRLGIPPAGDALLETIGRTTGEPRVTPVCDCLIGDTFWVIAQRGRDSGYVKNMESDHRVRVKVGGRWRTGTAQILDDDDPRERQRILARGNFARSLCLRASRAVSTSPLTVRIDLAPR